MPCDRTLPRKLSLASEEGCKDEVAGDTNVPKKNV